MDKSPLRADAARNLEQVLKAAPAVLMSDPGATMERLAEAGGIARATLYRHFETRDDLIAAIYHRALRETQDAIERAEPTEDDPTEALHRVIDAVLRVGDRYRFLAAGHPDSPSIRAHEEEVGGPLIALFERGQQSGAFRQEIPPRLMAGFLGAAVNLAVRVVDDGNATIDEAASAAWTLLLHGVGR